MKNLIVLALVLSFFGCAAVIKEKSPDEGKIMEYSGQIIDNACVASQKSNLGAFMQSYTKDAALNCTIGYSLFTSTGIVEFDVESTSKIDAFLKKPENTLFVKINGRMTEGKLQLLEISNQ